MGIIVAIKSGNWSDPTVWQGGVKPGPSDIAQSGNFIVTIDEDVTCVALEATGSGRFDVTAAPRAITANVIHSGTATLGALRCAHAAGTVTLTGNVTNNSATANAPGINNTAGGTVTITGNATGGSGTNAYGVNNTAGGTVTLNGSATGGSGPNAHGAANTSTGTLTAITAIGNGFGPGGTNANLANGVYGSGANGQTTTVKAIQSGPYGGAAVGGAVLIAEDANANTAQFRKTPNGATLTLAHTATTDPDYPAEADVRHGVAYANDDHTGTCAVPEPEQVAHGIAVDDAVGTALLTEAGVRGAVGMADADLDAQLSAIATAVGNIAIDPQAIIDAVTAALEDAEIDVDVVAVAAAVWSFVTRTLTTPAGPLPEANEAGTLSIHRGDTFSATITGLGDLSGRTKLYWTVKPEQGLSDAGATVQVEETGGLLRLNAAAAAVPEHGALVVDDEVAGVVTLTLAAEATAALAADQFVYDIQVVGEGVTTVAAGIALVTADVTRAVS